MKSKDDKIRIRSESELELQHNGLVELKSIFELIDLDFYLSDGALLGAVRDGDYIKWDWDVGLNVKTEEAQGKSESFIKKALDSGFKLDSYNGGLGNFKIVLLKNSAKYEIIGYKLSGKWRVRKSWRIPSEFFDNFETVTLRGVSFRCMSPSVKFLEWMYGDWKTPVRSAEKSKYISSKSFRSNEEFLKIYFKDMRSKLTGYIRMLLRH